MSATDLSPTRQIGCDMTGFFLFHTPQPLWRLHLGHVVLYIYLHAAVENSHSHYSSAEAVYKVSSINCLLLGGRTCGDMQQHIRCYYIATKGVDYIAIGRLTVWGHLSNRHRIVVCMVWERERQRARVVHSRNVRFIGLNFDSYIYIYVVWGFREE